MAKGLELKKTRVKELIAEIYLENPLWRAPKVHREVLTRIHEKNDPYYEPYLEDPKWPRENTVYQHLKKIQKKHETRSSKSKELDRPWSIATLDSYPISPEALLIVLKEYKRHAEQGTTFTIRQAKWVARLSATQCNSLPYLIAKTEQLYEILSEPPDFEIFDKLLAGLPGQADNWQVPFAAMASEAGILKNDPTKKGALQRNVDGANY